MEISWPSWCTSELCLIAFFPFPLWISLHTSDVIASLVGMQWRKHMHTHDDSSFLGFFFFGWGEGGYFLFRCLKSCKSQHAFVYVLSSNTHCCVNQLTDVMCWLGSLVGVHVADTAFTECSVKHPQLCVSVFFLRQSSHGGRHPTFCPS